MYIYILIYREGGAGGGVGRRERKDIYTDR
jgi:hypothetical protein